MIVNICCSVSDMYDDTGSDDQQKTNAVVVSIMEVPPRQ